MTRTKIQTRNVTKIMKTKKGPSFSKNAQKVH